jgi:hypothetical protein
MSRHTYLLSATNRTFSGRVDPATQPPVPVRMYFVHIGQRARECGVRYRSQHAAYNPGTWCGCVVAPPRRWADCHKRHGVALGRRSGCRRRRWSRRLLNSSRRVADGSNKGSTPGEALVHNRPRDRLKRRASHINAYRLLGGLIRQMPGPRLHLIRLCRRLSFRDARSFDVQSSAGGEWWSYWSAQFRNPQRRV